MLVTPNYLPVSGRPNCIIATPGCELNVTRCISLRAFGAEKKSIKSTPAHSGDRPDTRTRFSSNGSWTIGANMGGVISFTFTSASYGFVCATRRAAAWRNRALAVMNYYLYVVPSCSKINYNQEYCRWFTKIKV